MSDMSPSFSDICFMYACLQNCNYETINFDVVGSIAGMSPQEAQAHFLHLSRQVESTTALLDTPGVLDGAHGTSPNTTGDNMSTPGPKLPEHIEALSRSKRLEHDEMPSRNPKSRQNKRGRDINSTADEDTPVTKKRRTSEPNVCPRTTRANPPASLISNEEQNETPSQNPESNKSKLRYVIDLTEDEPTGSSDGSEPNSPEPFISNEEQNDTASARSQHYTDLTDDEDAPLIMAEPAEPPSTSEANPLASFISNEEQNETPGPNRRIIIDLTDDEDAPLVKVEQTEPSSVSEVRWPSTPPFESDGAYAVSDVVPLSDPSHPANHQNSTLQNPPPTVLTHSEVNMTSSSIHRSPSGEDRSDVTRYNEITHRSSSGRDRSRIIGYQSLMTIRPEGATLRRRIRITRNGRPTWYYSTHSL